jgi:hypothetical protein
LLNTSKVLRLISAIVLLAALLPALAIRAQDDASTPAARHAQVIAHGVAPLSDEQVSWQVRQAQANAPGRSGAIERDFGFVLADEGDIAIAETRGDIVGRLAPGEAAWTEPGEPLAVVSLDGTRQDYFAIALVAFRTGDSSSNIAPPSESFAAPAESAIDVDLIRGVLARAEESVIPGSDAPMLFLVTDGKVFLETADGRILQLSAGENITIEGNVVVVGDSRNPAAFVVVRLGPGVPQQVQLAESIASPVPASPVALARATPVALPRTPAQVTVTAFRCPEKYAGSDVASDCLVPAAEVAFSIEEDGDALLSALANPDGTVTFPDIPAGDYTLLAGLPREDASSRVLCRTAAGEEVAAGDGVSDVAFSLQTADAVACAWYIVPGVPVEATGASLTLAIAACPLGMSPERFAPDGCQPAPAGTTLSLRDAASGTPRGVTRALPAAWNWADLAAGTYDLDINAFPEGFVQAALDGLPCCGEVHDFSLVIPEGTAEASRTLYLFPEEVPRDITLTVAILACPPGMTTESLIAELCEPAPPGTTLTLHEWGIPLGVASVAPDAWVWSGLGPFTYELRVNAIPDGFSGSQLEGHPCCEEQTDLPVVLKTGMLEFQRALYLFRPAPADAEIDADDDGLSDIREAELATHPFLPDSDLDGILDGEEVNLYGTDPLNADTDDDRLDDAVELQTHGTNPFLADTDGDGVNDSREIAATSDPLDFASFPATPAPEPTATPVPTAAPLPATPQSPVATPDPLALDSGS